MPKNTERTITTIPALEEEPAKVRETGLAYDLDAALGA
jgi:DNA-binding IclR family transcriptional regulator